MLALRRAKQAAVRFGVALYERAVVLDADTFACDARAVDAVAAALERADVVVVSEARLPKCPQQIARVLGVADLLPEYNTGVPVVPALEERQRRARQPEHARVVLRE